MEGTVTREELEQTLDRAFGSLHDEVDTRFDRQTPLRRGRCNLMVGQTDELLQKVLDGLESHDQKRSRRWPKPGIDPVKGSP